MYITKDDKAFYAWQDVEGVQLDGKSIGSYACQGLKIKIERQK